jgi:hypothetical protein
MCRVSGGQWTSPTLAEGSLTALDEQERLAGEHEEVLDVGLPVVHPDRLAGREADEVDPELGEGRGLLVGQPVNGRLSPRPSRWTQRASRAFASVSASSASGVTTR